MNNDQTRDWYEILEVSPKASQATIERMYRYMAQRYHPDREGTGDANRFDQVVKAYSTLKDPESRAAYDSHYQTNLDYQWSLVQQAGDDTSFEQDSLIQDRILAVLYTQRKREPREPGLGTIQLEKLTGCPHEMLEFHLWYLRDKGWIMRTEDGAIAITGDGVDQSLQRHRAMPQRHLITEQ